MATINMQTMRYINLLDKTSHVKTQNCFFYNNTIFFAVPKNLVSKAIGQNAINIRKIQENLGRKVRVIAEPNGVKDSQKLVEDIVYPTKFKSLEIKEDEFILTAGNNQNKAILIGRNKRRLEELDKILNDFFSMDLKII
jgi:transcription antitermination factor NusA-like protein